MMQLDTWQEKITHWYQTQPDRIEELELLLEQAPHDVWGPTLSDKQSQAIACWLDGCLRVFEHARYHEHHKAYRCLMVISTRLEQIACRGDTDIAIRDWCIKRLQHVTVLILEFCNQQSDQALWHPQATGVIESHVKLMAHLNWNEPDQHDHRKHDQGVRH